MIEPSLAGRRIAVPETRELDVFADLLTRRGAQVLRCPLVAILDAPDPAPVLDWVRAFNAGAMSLLVLLTGEGLRRILSCVRLHAPELEAGFVARLGEVVKVTRGPKPAKALRELRLVPEHAAAEPTTVGVIETLRTLELIGRGVGVQLYGTEPNLPLVEFLRERGAQVFTVAPYVYADAAADSEVLRLVEELEAGRLDAIAFTSQAQVERLHALAEKAGRGDALRAGMARTLVAAVGPVVADALRAHGITVKVMPADSFFLKPLTQLLAQQLGPKPAPLL
ncbi:MAG TPA: uroporphyrinogen-III synthase [Solimonas sp.]|nr:uroporphyrinogen-III synthase [Solimonas sp.]